MDATLPATVDCLSQIALFRPLPSDDLERIARFSTLLDCPRGSLVFRQGSVCLGLYVVLAGQLKLTVQAPGGGETVLDLMGPGATCGEAPVFLCRRHIANAEALVDTTLLRVAADALRDEVHRNTGLAERIIAQLSHRLFQRTQDFGSHMTQSGTQRVIAYLMSQRPAGCAEKGVTLALRAKKGLIASRLNLTPAHFSRILGSLTDAGLIEVQGRQVRIQDTDRLASFAAD